MRGLLREQLLDDARDLWRGRPDHRLEGRDRLVDVVIEDRHAVLSRKRWMPDERAIERGAEGVEVRPSVDRLTETLLGRHVMRRPRDRAPRGLLGEREAPGEPEIHYLGCSVDR